MTNNWFETKQGKETALRLIGECVFGSAFKDMRLDSEELLQALAAFKVYHYPDLYETPQAFSDSFKVWWKHKGAMLDLMKVGAKISIAIEKEVNGEKTRVGLEVSSVIDGKFILDVVCQQLRDECTAQIERLAVSGGNSGNRSPRPHNNQTVKNAVVERAVKIIVSYDKKKLAKIITPTWAKWGIPVYEECLSQAGYDLDTLGLGEHEFPFDVEYICTPDGKPIKVIRIIKP